MAKLPRNARYVIQIPPSDTAKPQHTTAMSSNPLPGTPISNKPTPGLSHGNVHKQGNASPQALIQNKAPNKPLGTNGDHLTKELKMVKNQEEQYIVVDDGGLPLAEVQALQALYRSTNGDKWKSTTGWYPLDITKAIGVVVEEVIESNSTTSLRHVVSVDLRDNNLVGTVPSLQALSCLTNVQLSANSLTGKAPSFAGMSALVKLDLAKNTFTEELPCVDGCSSLECYRLWGNKFYGPLPDLSSCVRLVSIYLGGNQLQDALQPFVSLLPATVTEVNVAANKLRGTIPLMRFQHLENLYLWGNSLEGSLPGFSGCPSLKILDVSSNAVQGYYEDLLSAMPLGLKTLKCTQTDIYMPKIALDNLVCDSLGSKPKKLLFIVAVVQHYSDIVLDFLAVAEFHAQGLTTAFIVSVVSILAPALVKVYLRVYMTMDPCTQVKTGIKVFVLCPISVLLASRRCLAVGETSPAYEIGRLVGALFEAFPQSLLVMISLVLPLLASSEVPSVTFLLSMMLSMWSMGSAFATIIDPPAPITPSNSTSTSKWYRYIITSGYHLLEVITRLLVIGFMASFTEQPEFSIPIFAVFLIGWRVICFKILRETPVEHSITDQNASQRRLDTADHGAVQIKAKGRFGLVKMSMLMVLFSLISDSAWLENPSLYIVMCVLSCVENLVALAFFARADMVGYLGETLICWVVLLVARYVFFTVPYYYLCVRIKKEESLHAIP